MNYDELIYTKEDHIATITLNRPERMNALTWKTHTELTQAIEQAKNDDEVRVVIITGAGRGFCSGDDVGEMFLSGEGLPGCVIQGYFKCGMLGRMLTDWLGERGTLKKIAVSYRGMDFPGDTLTCCGKVTNKYVQEDENYIELEIWTENQRGEKTTPGTAVVTAPSSARR